MPAVNDLQTPPAPGAFAAEVRSALISGESVSPKATNAAKIGQKLEVVDGGENDNAQEPAEPPPVLPELYYVPSDRVFYRKRPNGDYQELYKEDVIEILDEAGFSKQTNKGRNSDAIKEIIKIRDDRSVAYAGPYAGHKAGPHRFGSKVFLATESPALIEPVEGDWSAIMGIIKGMFDDPEALPAHVGLQTEIACGWLAHAINCIRNQDLHPGLVLCMAGPPECGKSLFQQEIVTPLLGGGSASPFLFFTGRTTFNSELFAATHLMMGDVAHSFDMKSRLALGSNIKGVAAERVHMCHPKGGKGYDMAPFWRMTISCNDEPERMRVLPPMDSDIRDKIALLKVGKMHFPAGLGHSDRTELADRIRSELPAFVHYLVNKALDALRPEYRGGRFGVKAFHHPGLLGELNDLSPEITFLDSLDSLGIYPFEGRAADLFAKLYPVGDHRHNDNFERQQVGHHLKKLSDKRPDRVTSLPLLHGYRRWRIVAPAAQRGA